MSARVWVRGRVRVRASTLLRAPKAAQCARSYDHVARVGVLRGAVSTRDLSWLSLSLKHNDIYVTTYPNSLGCARSRAPSNNNNLV